MLHPPWIENPIAAWGSLSWRMGHGEEFFYDWRDRFRALPEALRTSYMAEWPEPEGWVEFYNCMLTGEPPSWHEHIQALRAEAERPMRRSEFEVTSYFRILWLIRTRLQFQGFIAPEGSERTASIYTTKKGSRWRLSAFERGGIKLVRQGMEGGA